LTIADTGNPLRLVVSVWRSILESFWRLPLLVLGSVLLYTFLYAYWVRELPFYIPRGFSQIPYGILHAVIFAPLVFAVVQSIVRGNVHQAEVWKSGAISVGCVMLAHEWGILALHRLVHDAAARPLLYGLLNRGVMGPLLVGRLFVLLNLSVFVVAFLLPMRLVLLLPIAAAGEGRWTAMLSNAWRDMRGHFLFALVIGVAALLPVVIADHFLQKLYRNLYTPHGVAAAAPWEQWTGFLVWSVNLALGYIATAALAAWLYRAIEARRAIGPSERLDPLPSKGADAPFSPGMKAH
jgi:hypothetical protein